MGKWKAEHIEYGQWHVTKDDMVIAYRADATEAQIFTELQATRYALALNVVDAGVDMGDAVGFMDLFNAEGELIKVKTDVEFVKGLIKVRDFLARIANAVEGSTKEEV